LSLMPPTAIDHPVEPALSGSTGPRSAIAVRANEAGSIRRADALSVIFATEAPDLERLAPIGDRAIAESIQDAWAAAGVDEPAPDFLGLHPGAVRSAFVPVERDDRDDERVSWVFRPDADSEHGWWLIHGGAGREGATDVGAFGALLSARGEGPARRFVSTGVARPRELLTRVTDLQAALGGELAPLQSLRWISSVSWRIWLTSDTLAHAEVTVRMAP